MRKELRVAGFGGQGVITVGVLMAKALGQYGNAHVAQTQSYGPEARGGACKTDVIISDVEIDYIKPIKLDVMASMSQPSLDAYAAVLSGDGILIVDSTLVTNVPTRFRKVFKIAATSLAEEKIDLPIVANLIMFGALVKITGWATPEACKKAIADTVPPKALDKNYAAFDLGYSQD
jgi:2-oxoglutarate ferredoxin oxidoreductase subunit gamma